MAGGSIGRNLYWRLEATSGNPLYFRDRNALAGDKGIRDLLLPHPDPKLKSGFPILYNTETEGYFLKTEHAQFGQAIGYRWQNDAQTFGYDAIAFHYRRTLLDGENAPLTGTFYGVDIDLLEGPLDRGLTLRGDKKEDTGARAYTKWPGLTSTAPFTKQSFAGLHRHGEEIEAGYQIRLANACVPTIQPTARRTTLAVA